MIARMRPIPATSSVGRQIKPPSTRTSSAGRDLMSRRVPSCHPSSGPLVLELDRVLISERSLRHRVRRLAARVRACYPGSAQELVVIALLKGSVPFVSDLVRHLNLPLRLDFIRASSYRGGTRSGRLVLGGIDDLRIRGCDVLVVDDIIDTGRTLQQVLKRLTRLQPRSIRTCVLLDKPSRREVTLVPDFAAFRIPDHFVVGYGLDYQERHRNLPFVGILGPRPPKGGRGKPCQPSVHPNL